MSLGNQKRLRDIQEALWQVGKPYPSQTCSSQTRTPAHTGHEKRLRDIKEALSGRAVLSEMTNTSVSTVQVTNLKRNSCSEPESPPKAKRRQFSPDSPESSPLPSSTNMTLSSLWSLPGSSTTDATASVHSSPRPEHIVTLLPEKVCICTHSESSDI
jgi:hypothetical protein